MRTDLTKEVQENSQALASGALADEYFQYLATCFPVMCASDEFHFLPRAQAAIHCYDKMEDLSPNRMSERIGKLKDYLKQIDLLARQEEHLERFIDLELLKANIAGVLIALETKEIWRHVPLLYLKIAFIGLDQVLTKPASKKKERKERILARLDSIPRLLRQGAANVTTVPETTFRASLSMVIDCQAYLSDLGSSWSRKGGSAFVKGLEKVRSALMAFDAFLLGLSPVPEERFKVERALETTLRKHFLCRRSLSEIFEIALEEWHTGLEQLRRLQGRIDPHKPWQELYAAYCPPEVIHLDTRSLYQLEIDRLRIFFQSRGFGDSTCQERLQLRETPTYLRSIRGAASFGAALSENPEEEDVFYLTTRRSHEYSKERSSRLKKRLHREFRFLCAHETFPGHHVLDAVRRRLNNPVRRQIESPLFYEGWATYAEFLLTEYRYVDDPMDLLVAWKRRLWRAARCQIDVGLNAGKLNKDSAIELLKTVGFSTEETQSQIDRFGLNPGYQLCYTLGSHEITTLEATYGASLGQEAFHEALMKGGELPFHLIEKRIARRGD
jgi:hypothetical protein